MSEVALNSLKRAVRLIARRYPDREQRARRLFMEERGAAFCMDREREFGLKTEIAGFFDVPYSAVGFCGSAQIGFSVHKDRLFQPAISDLDAVCVSPDLFQRAWVDVITSTSAFKDDTVFGRRKADEIARFKDQILRRGMIRIEMMPDSSLSRAWKSFQTGLSLANTDLFKKVTVTVYINEYAFCWKQDSALASLMGVSVAE